MAKWLTTLRDNMQGGVAKATEAQHLQVIEQGFNHFLNRARNPQAGQVITSGPLYDTAVVRNERMLVMFLGMMVAAGTEQGRWGNHRFYYPCRHVPSIERTQAWQAIERACRHHGTTARLGHNADIWHFENADWSLCEVFICLM
jgi:hypothetical protein